MTPFNTQFIVIEPEMKLEDFEKVFADLKDITFKQRQPGYDELVEKIEVPHFFRANFEHVSVNTYLCKDGTADMFVDDCGSLKALPINPIATAIYYTASEAHKLARFHPEMSMKELLKLAFENAVSQIKAGGDQPPFPAIHGRAVLFMDRVWF